MLIAKRKLRLLDGHKADTCYLYIMTAFGVGKSDGSIGRNNTINIR
jgi:hypothetical protein